MSRPGTSGSIEPTEPTYVFDAADTGDRQRVDDQSRLWDPFTFRMLAATEIGLGWRCLEIGAGTGTVAAWLVDRVGPDGMVIATDVETRWLEPLMSSNLVVRHHNVVADPLEPAGYDLVHARLVLMHLPQREAVVAKLAAALRPGGWLVIDDYDLRTITAADPPHPAWTGVARAVIAAWQAAGADPHYGSRLIGALRSVGLADVTAEAMVHPTLASDLAPAFAPAVRRLRARIVATGLASEEDVDAALAELHDRADPIATYSPMMVSARGRRTG